MQSHAVVLFSLWRVVLVGSFLATVACADVGRGPPGDARLDTTEESVCLIEGVYHGLAVVVKNANTGVQICDATVVATVEGVDVELNSSEHCFYEGLTYYVGSCDLRVDRPGFIPAVLLGVHVEGDVAHCVAMSATVVELLPELLKGTKH